MFVEATADQTRAEFFATASRMFRFFGGVPVLMTTDNFPAVIRRPRRGSNDEVPTIAYQAFADHYGYGIVATRVRKPRDKGLVEGAVRIAQEYIMARIRNRVFFSLAELNAAIAPLLSKLNARPMRDHGNQSRDDLFEVDRKGFSDLPPTDYEDGDWILNLRAGRDYRIRVFGAQYSVPYQYASEYFNAHVTRSSVHIYRNSLLIRTHLRASTPGQDIVDSADMPESHRAAVRTRLAHLKSVVSSVGPAAVEFVERHYRLSHRPRHTAEAADRLLLLARSYGDDRVEAACAKACQVGSSSTVKVESILRNGADKITPRDTAPADLKQPSGNVRGREYFEDQLRKGGRPNV